jgi:transposase
LEARQVVEVSAGRKLEDVTALLERLCDPDAVKAVSMDMSASFRPAVQLCLPKAQIVVDHFHDRLGADTHALEAWEEAPPPSDFSRDKQKR